MAKKMYKKIGLGLFVGLMGAATCSCQTKEQKEYAQKVAKQGETNALLHMERKYGIDESELEIVSSEPMYDTEFFSTNTNGNVVVTLKHGDKEFEVNIHSEEENDEGTDSYQYYDIVNAVADKFERMYGENYINVSCRTNTDIHVKSGLSEDKISYRYFEGYYDGNNLDDIVENELGEWYVQVISTDEDILSLDDTEICDYLGPEIEVVLIKAYSEKNCEYLDNFVFRDNFEISNFGILIDKYKISGETVDLETVDLGDFHVVMDNGTYCNSKKVTDVTWNNQFVSEKKRIFDNYELETDASKITVFIEPDVFSKDGALGKDVKMDDMRVAFKNSEVEDFDFTFCSSKNPFVSGTYEMNSEGVVCFSVFEE